MSTVEAPKPALGELLADEAYVRRRLDPKLWDLDYLVLTDLRELVLKVAGVVRGRLLDYGSGAAPYRAYFKHCTEYVAADVTPGPNIDRLLEPDGSTSEPADAYDFVLSTQVLEHVKDAEGYLAECYRILRPGGRLLLTTHGMVEEHGCPYDFHRWTCRGLENLAIAQGFTIQESYKFTTEIRGIVQLLHQFAGHLRCPNQLLVRYLLAAVRRCYYWFCVPVLNWIGARLPHQGVIPGEDPATLYVGIGILAVKK
jgi:SAM-dependent methyltransferase